MCEKTAIAADDRDLKPKRICRNFNDATAVEYSVGSPAWWIIVGKGSSANADQPLVAALADRSIDRVTRPT